MSSEIDLEQLARDVRYVKDRLAIQDCVMRHARGHDRHDVELMTSCFHEDGIDEDGDAITPGPEYGEWANAAHSAGFGLHAHHITGHTCELDGDVAYAETYVLGCLTSPDETRVSFASGRYVDQLERRDAEWRIVARRTVIDAVGETEMTWRRWEGHGGFLKGARSAADASYLRPVVAGGAGQRWSDSV
jgi:SnoaL-like domain